MTAHSPIVVDSNILFSALLRNESQFTELILNSDRTFYICESVIVELFKHKERIVQISNLSSESVVRLFYILLRHVTVLKENLIQPEIRKQAYALCADIDEADTPHVALTLHVDGLLWTGDKKLKSGLERRKFNRFFETG